MSGEPSCRLVSGTGAKVATFSRGLVIALCCQAACIDNGRAATMSQLAPTYRTVHAAFHLPVDSMHTFDSIPGTLPCTAVLG